MKNKTRETKARKTVVTDKTTFEKPKALIMLRWHLCAGCGNPSIVRSERCSGTCDNIKADIARGVDPYRAAFTYMVEGYALPSPPTKPIDVDCETCGATGGNGCVDAIRRTGGAAVRLDGIHVCRIEKLKRFPKWDQDFDRGEGIESCEQTESPNHEPDQDLDANPTASIYGHNVTIEPVYEAIRKSLEGMAESMKGLQEVGQSLDPDIYEAAEEAFDVADVPNNAEEPTEEDVRAYIDTIPRAVPQPEDVGDSIEWKSKGGKFWFSGSCGRTRPGDNLNNPPEWINGWISTIVDMNSGAVVFEEFFEAKETGDDILDGYALEDARNAASAFLAIHMARTIKDNGGAA